MATYNIHYDKPRLLQGKDSKVYIRITQNRDSVYVDTGHYLNPAQVNKKMEIKDDDFCTTLLNIRRKFKKWVDDEIGEDIGSYKSTNIKKFIEGKLRGNEVDFFAFGMDFAGQMDKNGKGSTASILRKSLNGFRDFLKRDKLDCNDITSELLKQFGDYLKKARIIKRNDQFGREREMKLRPLDDYGVGEYYSDLRSIFYAARELYNDDEAGIYIIKRNPFKKLEIKVKKTGGSQRSAEIEVFREILKMEDSPFHRVNMARDAILLSFMLMGMPPVDIYKVDEYKDGRISYKRSKTKDKRDDGAFFSIKVYPEVEPLIQKYRDPSGERVFIFHKIYADAHAFGANMNKGLGKVREICGIEQKLTMYMAKHTVGTILRNHFKMPKSDVAECLNHATGQTVTDYYIKKDFTRVDNAIRRLLDYLFEGGGENPDDLLDKKDMQEQCKKNNPLL